MPPRGVKKGTKRARQYEHIKDSLEERGASEDRAEEIAARTVNKERARHGESQTPRGSRGKTSPRAGAAGFVRTGGRLAGAREISSTRRRRIATSAGARR